MYSFKKGGLWGNYIASVDAIFVVFVTYFLPVQVF